MKKKRFVSEISVTKDVYEEFYNSFIFGNIRMIVILLLALVLVYLITKSYIPVMWLTLTELFSLVFYSFILRRHRRIGFERILEAHGGEQIKTKITINEEKIEEIDVVTGNKTYFNFSQIQGTLETDNLLVLRLKYNLGIILGKNNLKGGTIDELVEYLKRVCALKDKNCKKFNPKLKYLGRCFGVLLFVLFISLVYVDIRRTVFIDRLIDAFENNGYIVDLYSPEDAELVVYGIYKEEKKQEFYLYYFKDEKIAKASFDDWLEDDKKELGIDSCSKDKEYYTCYIKNDTLESLLIRKNNIIFYGIVENIEKQELDDAGSLFREVK